jgi:hypothetical protein
MVLAGRTVDSVEKKALFRSRSFGAVRLRLGVANSKRAGKTSHTEEDESPLLAGNFLTGKAERFPNQKDQGKGLIQSVGFVNNASRGVTECVAT